MYNTDQLFELMTKMYSEMQDGFKEVKGGINGIKGGIKELKISLRKVEDRITIIEQDHGRKLDMLFDGYKQNADKLDRIEKEVTKNEEIILRRIK